MHHQAHLKWSRNVSGRRHHHDHCPVSILPWRHLLQKFHRAQSHYVRKETYGLVLQELLRISGSFALEEIILDPLLRNSRPSRITESKTPTDEKSESQRREGTCPGMQSPERGTCQSPPAILKALSSETSSYLSFILHKTLCSALCGSLWKIGKSSYSLIFPLAHSRA